MDAGLVTAVPEMLAARSGQVLQADVSALNQQS